MQGAMSCLRYLLVSISVYVFVRVYAEELEWNRVGRRREGG